ncbi:acetylornithine deacetylase/succinyl-diaminopimelate desuccinylase-like protein [Sphingomonas insulae]|uniref:M20/M25/M40 family metallo-hydrolase n=1 Tax=Sphingomonas insulae TaxID=424800 RepID=A0ABP3T1R1_9SPHN|nr:M20/M25/M40 family metallo-hydrolase [Sphingomonas insulae]NIJ29095.1 acetylornithine deacetylase/succinyl-diaminopimelate desuccinylase-like protein [Sphingomonas insulae]
MMQMWRWMAGTLALAVPGAADAQQLRPDQTAFRALYQELVETDTSITTGSCTALADKVAVRLKAAGYADDQITSFAAPDHPKEGGLVVVLPGSSATAKPMLLLGHIDVVAAKREDWTRDPYKMVEENGYFYGSGTQDMKAMDAIWIDSMIRFKQSGYRPKRTIKLALTCGEETSTAFNGAQWLAKNKPDLIAAEFALNEGGGGRSDGNGKLVIANMHVGEKAAVNYRIEATNPGGHSSAPVRDNAIYELADALVKLRAYDFPVQLSDTTRAYFRIAGKARGDAMGQAMVAIAADPADKTAEATLNGDKSYHSMLRTTCVATLLDGGHANNALPQRAAANVNCRIFPGVSAAQVRETIATVIDDPRMTVKQTDDRGPAAVPPPLDPKIIKPAETLLAKYYPGVPLAPTMSTGATDGIYLGAIGIPVYGPPGVYGDPDGNGTHGLNERASVKAVYTGRDYLYDLVRAYAG